MATNSARFTSRSTPFSTGSSPPVPSAKLFLRARAEITADLLRLRASAYVLGWVWSPVRFACPERRRGARGDPSTPLRYARGERGRGAWGDPSTPLRYARGERTSARARLAPRRPAP